MALTVGRLAQAAGVGVETIRFYERRGLITQPERRGSAYRVYHAADVTRIQFIKRAQALGFTLNEIAELIQLEQDSHARCADLQQRADEKIRAVDQKLAELTRMRAELLRLSTSCAPEQALEQCQLMNCLTGRC